MTKTEQFREHRTSYEDDLFNSSFVSGYYGQALVHILEGFEKGFFSRDIAEIASTRLTEVDERDAKMFSDLIAQVDKERQEYQEQIELIFQLEHEGKVVRGITKAIWPEKAMVPFEDILINVDRKYREKKNAEVA